MRALDKILNSGQDKIGILKHLHIKSAIVRPWLPNQVKIVLVLDGLIKLGQEGGMSKLWSGTSSSLVLVSNPTIKFTVYEFLKRLIARHNHNDQNLSAFKVRLFLGIVISIVFN